MLVESAHPDQEGLRVEQEDPSSLLQIPATSRPQLEDAHPLDGRVVGSAPRSGPLPPAILDAQLLPEQRDLGIRLIELRLEAMATDGTTTRVRENDSCERDSRGAEVYRIRFGYSEA